MGKKTRVVHFIWALADGGAETLVKDYSVLINKNKFEVKLFCLHNLNTTANSQLITDAGIDVCYVYKKHNLLSKLSEILFGFFYIPFRFLCFVKDYKPNVIHLHIDTMKYAVPIRKLLKDTKLFYTCHSPVSEMFDKKKISQAKKLLSDNKINFIALNKTMKNEIDNLLEIRDTNILYNGLDIERFTKVSETKEEIRQKERIPLDSFVIGHVGRFSEEKNHLFLIDVFKEVVNQRNNAFLLLVGNGPQESAVEAKIKSEGLDKKVLHLSHRSDIPRLLKAMDVFVFPSVFEGFGIALSEAQIAGLRCVCSDAVPRECIVSPKTKCLNLNDGIDHWVEAVLDESFINSEHESIENCDIRNNIEKLESLYLDY